MALKITDLPTPPRPELDKHGLVPGSGEYDEMVREIEDTPARGTPKGIARVSRIDPALADLLDRLLGILPADEVRGLVVAALLQHTRALLATVSGAKTARRLLEVLEG